MNLAFNDKPYSKCFTVVILKSYYSFYTVNEKSNACYYIYQAKSLQRCFSACGYYMQEVQSFQLKTFRLLVC